MFNKLMLAVCLTGLFIFCKPATDADTIPWAASRKLTWADFKKNPDESSTNAALTSSKTTFKFGYDSDNGLSFNISCVFDKKSSWGRVKTDYILAHEQGHFDIAEIHARRLNKALKNYSFNKNTVSKDIPAIYEKVMKEQAAMQNEYDAETDFSRNKEQQALWIEKINKQLKDLSEYAGYH